MRRHGHFHVNPDAPEPCGICDRCGRLWSLAALNFQMEWSGTSMRNTNLRVCPSCMDKPAEFLKTIVIPQDPVPVRDPRPIPPYQGNKALDWDEEGGAWDDDQGSEWGA